MKKYLPVIYFLFTCFLLSFPKHLHAQVSPISGVALTVPIADQTAKNGDIVCSIKSGYAPCSNSYDSGMYGVINDNPIGSVELPGGGRLVNTTGSVVVNVTSVSGSIKVGDFITTSTNPGVGQLAIHNGYVLGIAQGDYSDSDKIKIGQILVSISIHPTIGISDNQTDLFRSIREGLLSAQISPLATLRYLTAALMVITGFGLGFIYFGRIAKAGVEAIGRNPLSSRTIEFGLILHILLTIVIVAAGLGIGYLILTL
jgi:F0F1-type ATP synthase membrane subunit c/vacuolar-type H+-ATPase subunit K